MNVMSRVLVAAGIGAAAVLAVPTGAQATPANCSVTLQHKTATAICTAGSGQVRAAIECLVMKPGDPFEVIHYGGWVPIGLTSQARCANGNQVLDYWYETRG
jgi:hypothetical protein